MNISAYQIEHNINYLINNVSNRIAMYHVIYFIATAVAPSAFRPTQ